MSVQTKDSDDKSFSDFLTEQPTLEKADASANLPGQAKGKPAGRKSSGTTAPSTKSAAKTTHVTTAGAVGKNTDGVKQSQHDDKKDPADTDSKIASTDKPNPVPDAGSDSTDPDQGGNDTGNQNQSDGSHDAGKDAAPADASLPAAPDLNVPPPAPLQQASTDAMAQAATASMQTPMVQPSAPPLPSGQDIAAGGIGAGRSRSRLPDVPQTNNSTPFADIDTDSDLTAIDDPTAGSVSAAAPQTIPAATVPAPGSQNAGDPDLDDVSDAAPDALPATNAAPAATQPAANPQPSSTIAPPPGPVAPSSAAAPPTLIAQNNKKGTPDTKAATTTSPATNSPATISQDSQPLSADNNVPATQPTAPQPKTTEDGFKLVVAKNSDQKSADARADTSGNVPEIPAPAPQPVQPPASPMIALGNAGAAQALSGNPAPTATIHVGPETANATPNVNSLAVEIAAKSQSGAKQFDIRLDPPELGRVEVRLSIDASGKAEAHMTADQPQTLHLLQKDSDILTRALRDAGLDVSQDGLNFSLRGQDRQNGQGQNDSRGGTASRALQATKIIESMPVNAIAYSSAGNARLDIHV